MSKNYLALRTFKFYDKSNGIVEVLEGSSVDISQFKQGDLERNIKCEFIIESEFTSLQEAREYKTIELMCQTFLETLSKSINKDRLIDLTKESILSVYNPKIEKVVIQDTAVENKIEDIKVETIDTQDPIFKKKDTTVFVNDVDVKEVKKSKTK